MLIENFVKTALAAIDLAPEEARALILDGYRRILAVEKDIQLIKSHLQIKDDLNDDQQSEQRTDAA